MKYIVDKIVQEIKDNINKSNDETLFLVNGFENLDVYVKISQRLTEYAKQKNKEITIKLAKNKWEYFKKKNSGSPNLHIMQHNNWVLTNESTTEYRNKHASDILLLLGTETESDSSGSLREISQINCSDFYKLLPMYKKQIDYSDVFVKAGLEFGENEKLVINKLYKDLFEFVNKDICKLSDFVDKNYQSIVNINDFIEIFYKNLPYWGLPKRELKLPLSSQIILKNGKGKKKNLLRSEFNFITGQTFKNLVSASKKVEKQFIAYEQEGGEYSSLWDGWNNQSIHSYDEFQDIVIKFIHGDRTSKDTLLKMDFSIIEDILDLKIASESKGKKSVIKVYGSPMKAFMTSYMYVLNETRKNMLNIDSINFDFKRAELVSEVSSIKNIDELIDLWKNICIHSNGVFESIAKYSFSISNINVDLSYTPNNFFDPCSNNIDYLHAAASTKKLNKVEYTVQGFDNDNEIKKYSFEWKFKSNESWLYDFNDVLKSDFIKNTDKPYIPLTTLDNIETLLHKKSEEEFFDYFVEKSNLNFSCNILEKCCHTDIFHDSDIYQMFNELGEKFVDFCQFMSINGLYVSLITKDEKFRNLVKLYRELGEKIVNSKFNENQYFILDYFIHAFNIEKNDFSITKDKDVDCCIVPPWHPASLEKIKHRILFFLDGCYEFWNEIDEVSQIKHNKKDIEIDEKIDELIQLSMFQNSLDIFPSSNNTYFGPLTSYGNYSLYAKDELKAKDSLRDLIKKEYVFDDEFENTSYNVMNKDSYMIYDVLKNYIKAFPNTKDKLNIVFINPSDLQPIVSTLHRYIKEFQSKYGEDENLYISLSILVTPENKGGKNYITYWMNQYFDLDSNVKIKTYMNEWNTREDLIKLIDGNNDIVFFMDLLKTNDYEFINNIDHYEPSLNECYFPIVLRTSPVSNTTMKRRVELTQPQFKTSSIHTQIVHYRKNLEYQTDQYFYAVKTVEIDNEIQKLIFDLHKKAYWVVCVDSCMDGKLLKESNLNEEYAVIGFSTGKGKNGQYNLTITARNSILQSIQENFSRRLSRMFDWKLETVKKAAKICMNEAKKLDGISVLTASNQKDYNINEFMAYVLTSLKYKEDSDDSPLKIIVHLDSYKHWFSDKYDAKDIFDDEFTKSRPDFLLLKVNKDFREELTIDATVIECKMATYFNKDVHVEKAIGQVKHGIEVLSKKFNSQSTSIKRRYWFAQLYRSLSFAQISFNDSSDEFTELSNKLRGILNGNFKINWHGQILGYWLDMDGNTEVVDQLEDGIKLFNIPQQRVQSLILGSEENVKFVNIDQEFLEDEQEFNKQIESQEKDIDEMVLKSKISNIDEQIDETLNENEKESLDLPIDLDKNIDVVVDDKNSTYDIKKLKSENISQINSSKNNYMDNSLSQDIRVLIGKDRFKNDVYWEFGNKQMANRHLLITGTSGQGKTYSIQTMLYELAKFNISSVIFDYTEGFRLDQLEPKFVEKMGDKILQHVVKIKGVPINPFKQNEIEVAGEKMLETPADVASRFANILVHVYGFGDQQFAAIFDATRKGLEKYGKNMNMKYFQEELQDEISVNKTAKSVLSKMQPFFYGIDFKNNVNEFDWGEILYPKENVTTIFQLTHIDREMQIIITELLLWDAWYYTIKRGTKDKPFVVVLDEAQNLSHKVNSPSAKILTEGRKFGWSAWFATQSLKILSDDEIVRLLQSSFKLYFKPTDEEIIKMAKQLDPSDGSLWVTPFKNLRKGQCIVVGDRIRNDNTFGATKPTITNVISFDERE